VVVIEYEKCPINWEVYIVYCFTYFWIVKRYIWKLETKRKYTADEKNHQGSQICNFKIRVCTQYLHSILIIG